MDEDMGLVISGRARIPVYAVLVIDGSQELGKQMTQMDIKNAPVLTPDNVLRMPCGMSWFPKSCQITSQASSISGTLCQEIR